MPKLKSNIIGKWKEIRSAILTDKVFIVYQKWYYKSVAVLDVENHLTQMNLDREYRTLGHSLSFFRTTPKTIEYIRQSSSIKIECSVEAIAELKTVVHIL